MTKERPELAGPSVILRRPVEADLEALRRLPLDPEAMRMFGVHLDTPKPRTDDDAVEAYRELLDVPHLWVIDAGAGYIGHVKLHSLNVLDRRAALAIWIEDQSARGKGHGTEAIALVLRYAFGPLGLHRVGIRVLAINERAIRAYRACGFVFEGRERETARLDGIWHDDLILGCLDREFEGSVAAGRLSGTSRSSGDPA